MMTYPHAAAGLKTVYQARLVGLISISFCLCGGRGVRRHLWQYSIDRYRCIITGFAVLCMHYHQSPTERNGCRGKSD